ncbi:hypothetical protein DFR58_1282 [Anaerobacterium chartisolvens]|uniref:Uncharacterized protein n=1 Tax=Anaerobacterium chartisolvens TaxID=1297424 RepID=A0A369AN76_9FIRM|nr:hypothetical protein [Anaerobacterium chartisolvens]RCX10503.1 hypothetical protein DFR58_1282 [Anaerobacterium chartisolvens]
MFEINNKQYILKSSAQKTIDIFYKSGMGLCTGALSETGSRLKPSVLLEDAAPGFAACIDQDDIIHIICPARDGSIMYIYSEDGQWISDKINAGKECRDCYKFFSIVSLGKTLYFFYVREEKEKKVLLFQTKYRQNPAESQQEIDIIKPSAKFPYRLSVHSDTIYITYNNANEKYSQLGCRMYNRQKDNWSNFNVISSNKANIESGVISSVCDNQGNVHICWQKTTPLKCELVYSRKKSTSETWEEQTLASSPYNFFNASMLLLNNRSIVYWVRERNIFYCASEDGGNKWSNPKKYIFFSDKSLYCLQYLQNPSYRSLDIFINELPGTLEDGYKLSFIDDFLNERKEKDGAMNESQMLIVNTLKILTGNLDDQKKYIDRLKQKIDEIGQKQALSEMDLGILTEKLTSLNGDMMSMHSELEDMGHRINELEISNTIKAIEREKQSEPPSLEKQDESLKEAEQKQDYTSNPSQNSEKKRTLMAGGGFAGITPEYLWSLHKR